MSSQAVTSAFTKHLPKIDLHAHLTGSISPQTLHQIWQQQQLHDETSSQLLDPLIALAPPSGQKHHNILTFFKLFDTYIYNLCNTREAVFFATKSVLLDFASDGVRYLELRTTPREALATGLTKEMYVGTVLEAIDAFHLERKDEMSVYLILSIDRRNSAQQAEQVVDLAISYKNRGVIGVDLCGNPLVPLDRQALSPAFQRAKQAGLRVTLHFAEVPASSSTEELQFLLDLHPDRIGHVIHLPRAIEETVHARCAKGELGLELCLSCNVLAKMLPQGEDSDFQHHHFGTWLKRRDVPIALCTDDVGVFGSPVSNENLLAAEHFNLNREDLVDVARRGVGMIFGGEEEKRRLERLLDEFEA